MTNREKAQSDPAFIAACRKAGIPNTREEFRKWKGGKGLAHRRYSEGIDTTVTTQVQRSTI